MKISTNDFKKIIFDYLTKIENENNEIEIHDGDASSLIPSLMSYMQEQLDYKLLHEFENDILENLITNDEQYRKGKKIKEIVFELD